MSNFERHMFESVRESSKFFEVYIRIKIFGHVVFERTIPADDK